MHTPAYRTRTHCFLTRLFCVLHRRYNDYTTTPTNRRLLWTEHVSAIALNPYTVSEPLGSHNTTTPFRWFTMHSDNVSQPKLCTQQDPRDAQQPHPQVASGVAHPGRPAVCQDRRHVSRVGRVSASPLPHHEPQLQPQHCSDMMSSCVSQDPLRCAPTPTSSIRGHLAHVDQPAPSPP